MGNYRFRLSDMMPNAWFYKLKAGHHHAARKRQPPGTAAAVITTKPDEQQQPPNPSRPRKSYYFTRDLNLVQNEDCVGSGKSCSSASDLAEPPRKSAKQRTRKRNSRASPKRVTSSAACSCRLDSVWAKSGSPTECFSSPLESTPEQNSGEENVVPPRGESFDGMVSTWCSCRVKSDKLDSISDLHHLPPIIAKPAGFNDMIDDIRRRDHSKELKEQSIQKTNNNPARKTCVNSPGVKLRVNSPKIASKKIQSAGRRSVSGTRRSISDSCAVVKTSMDPQKDFRESMMEMIVENNLRASKDLEDLLACYLSLNSDEYHALIIKVFKQIWFDLSDRGIK